MARPQDVLSNAAAVHLVTLMDKESRDHWIASQLKADELPLLEDVTKFILMRIKTWDDPKGEQRLVNVPWNRGESAPKYEPGNNRKRTYDQRDKRSNDGNGRSGRKRMMECYRCKGDHTIVFCQVFRKDSADKRNEVATEFGLCRICYGRHPAKTCTARCYKCQGEHISLFCSEK